MPEPAIRAENLTYRYGDLLAVDHISFDVAEGEILGFLGPNGAGKTTAVKLLTGQMRPKEGKATLLGMDITRQTEKIQAQIGVCFEIANLYEAMTGIENLQLFAELFGLKNFSPRALLERVGLGDRVSQTVNSVTTDFVLDLAVGLTQVLEDGSNAYLYGNERIAEYDENGTEYYLPDALGSVRQIADEDGELVLSQHFEAYGEVLNSQGAGESRYGFTGEWQQDGLVYLRARFYSPSIMQFIQADTIVPDPRIPADWNKFTYVADNPVNNVDPSGMCVDNNHDGKCDFGEEPPDPDKPPKPYYPYEPISVYQRSLAYGVNFVNQLLYHQWIYNTVMHKCEKSWWSEYMSDGEKRWRLMLSLAFDWESHSMRRNPIEWPKFRDMELEAFSRKYWYFYDGYGVAGKYIFLGSMETVRNRTITFDITKDPGLFDPHYFDDVYKNLIPRVLRGEWRGAIRNKPFDFGNPELATPDKYYLYRSVKEHNQGPNPKQISYFTPDKNAFIITYDQWVCLNKPEKKPDGTRYYCCDDYQNRVTPP